LSTTSTYSNGSSSSDAMFSPMEGEGEGEGEADGEGEYYDEGEEGEDEEDDDEEDGEHEHDEDDMASVDDGASSFAAQSEGEGVLSPTPSEIAQQEDEARLHEQAAAAAAQSLSDGPTSAVLDGVSDAVDGSASSVELLASPHGLVLAPVDEAGEGVATANASAVTSPSTAAATAAAVAQQQRGNGYRLRAASTASVSTSDSSSSVNSKASSFAKKRAKLSRARPGTMPAALSSHERARVAAAHGQYPHEHHHAASASGLTGSGSGSGGNSRRRSRGSRSSRGGSQSHPPPPPQEVSLCKEDLVELEIIGRGQNGLVRKAVHLPTLTRVALKSMDIYEKSTRHQLLHELHAYSGLNSPYLVSFLGAYHDSGRIFLASEYMDCGSLSHFVHRTPQRRITDERLLRPIAAQCLAGLAYLHAHHRVHRDIKPDNILLSSSRQVKLADFGLMKRVSPSHPFCDEFLGTLAYLAPERLQSREYSFPADVWSLGVSLILACTGELPVVGADFWEFVSAMEKRPPSLRSTLNAIETGEYERHRNKQRANNQEGGSKKSDNVAASLGENFHSEIPASSEQSSGGDHDVDGCKNGEVIVEAPLEFSESFHDFLACMLQMDPAERWSASALLEHPWLTEVAASETEVVPAPQSESVSESEDSEADFAWAWQHEHVASANARDLDIILNLLATRQISKLADAESRRIRRQGSGRHHDGSMVEDEEDYKPVPAHARTPGHAVAPAFPYPAAAISAMPAPAPAPVPPPTLEVFSPPPPPSTLDGHSVPAHGLASTLSTASSSSLGSEGVFSPEQNAQHHLGFAMLSAASHSPASMASQSSVSSNGSSLFSPSTCGAMSVSHASSMSSTGFGYSPYPPTPFSASSVFGSPPPMNNTMFASPSPDPPVGGTSGGMMAASSLGAEIGAFVLPAAPTMTLSSGSEHQQQREQHQSVYDHSLTLPAAPSMMMLPAAPDGLSSSSAAATAAAASSLETLAPPHSALAQRRMSVPSTGVVAAPDQLTLTPLRSSTGTSSGGGVSVAAVSAAAAAPSDANGRDYPGGAIVPTTVEIVAVVSQLDESRLAVLAQQYGRPAEEIQARFAAVQLALFDQIEAQACATLGPPNLFDEQSQQQQSQEFVAIKEAELQLELLPSSEPVLSAVDEVPLDAAAHAKMDALAVPAVASAGAEVMLTSPTAF